RSRFQYSRIAGHPGIEPAGYRGDWVPRFLGGEESTQRGAMVGPIRRGGFAVWSRRHRGAAGRGRGVVVRKVGVAKCKAGVGKSTTAINLAAAMVELDRRVLLIDADPSGNAALGLFARGAPAVGLADALLDGLRLDEVAVPSEYPGLDLVPPGDRLSLCS